MAMTISHSDFNMHISTLRHKLTKTVGNAEKAGEIQYQLADCYLSANYVYEALNYLRSAIENGHKEAMDRFVGCLMKEYEKIKFDTELLGQEAKFLFDRINHRMKHKEAARELACRLQQGKGVHANKKLAVNLFFLAACQAHLEAPCDLFKCFFSGEGVAASQEEAMRWWQRALMWHSPSAILVGEVPERPLTAANVLWALDAGADPSFVSPNGKMLLPQVIAERARGNKKEAEKILTLLLERGIYTHIVRPLLAGARDLNKALITTQIGQQTEKQWLRQVKILYHPKFCRV